MQKPETKFRLWFEREFVKYATDMWHVETTIQKHADVVTSGVADIEVLLCGITLWLELKVVPATTVKRKLGLTKLQERFLAIRAHHGIPAFALVGRPFKSPEPGYQVALYTTPLPTHVFSIDFQPLPIVAEFLRQASLRAADGAWLCLCDTEGTP